MRACAKLDPHRRGSSQGTPPVGILFVTKRGRNVPRRVG